ncbi:MAG: type II toxin-antitoxin system RelE/ParE family toxin [Candidatus Binatia bacterium]
MEVVFHPSAREELDASIDFYEAHLKGLGGRFLIAVEEAIGRIAGSPDAGLSLAGGLRKRIVPGFPFSVVYRTLRQEQIFIVAVAHQHRRPGYWSRRRGRG